ncbi:mannose-1-phosphate guanylyltransferase [Syntrophomonas wolfei]|uniref:mannose-1-phosphate guanylyltransferase n=1 Tax=Syntrophomonas wolfei TaxID=863 RepID=UPI000674C1B7|nr:sugar phosphate nucleotidyltransferase [Syntrophomonas wolfei]
MISVVLAGGQGLRLWPESTEGHPKQLCDFLGRGSLLAMTLQRLQPLGSLLVVAGESQRNILEPEVVAWQASLLTEPLGRNTAPAVGLVLAGMVNAGDEVLGIFPADHHIENDVEFRRVLEVAVGVARQGYLVTVGIVPAYAETGYGYIERDGEMELDSEAYVVKAFHEKPDASTAREYLQNGNFYWNAGIFLATVETWRGLMQEFMPGVYSYILQGQVAYREAYPAFPNISIDYAIAEKCQRMAVVEGSFGWSDIGSWDALAAVLEQDDDGNAMSGTAVAIECRGCLGRSREKKLVLFGLEDMVAVETDDTILVCPRSRSQDIKSLLDTLKE